MTRGRLYPLWFRAAAHALLGLSVGLVVDDLVTVIGLCLISAIFLAVLFDIAEGVHRG